MLLAEERRTVEEACSGDDFLFLQVLPGKVFLELFAEQFGLKRNAYVRLICRALGAGPDTPLADLGRELEMALAPHLPARSIAD